jgi:hypothetical protein
MRLRVSGLRRVVKRSLDIEFGREQLSSYDGLEFVRQYFEIISLNRSDWAIGSAAADDRHQWDSNLHRQQGGLGDARFRSPPSQRPQLLSAAGASGPDRADPAGEDRPGNVHDSKGAEAFLPELMDGLPARFGRSLDLEFRMDAAFFQENLLKLLDRRGCFYAVKVPFCQ